jgi:ATP-dependent Clp protease ATP-binding subunit ClpA
MTSNLGTKEANVMGFAKEEGIKTERAINAFFAPEFRNRLSAVVPFNPLGLDVLESIVEKEIGKLNDQLADKNVTIKVGKKARRYLAQKGYDERYGARHIARVIDEEIKEALTDEMLFGKLKEGGRVKIKLDEESDTLRFVFEEA